ncbi:MAG: hypothetical protein J2P49_06010, partial [Methylocapsa sp.]|nr:hypothetical protein [Methylocapsa sp.]
MERITVGIGVSRDQLNVVVHPRESSWLAAMRPAFSRRVRLQAISPEIAALTPAALAVAAANPAQMCAFAKSLGPSSPGQIRPMPALSRI